MQLTTKRTVRAGGVTVEIMVPRRAKKTISGMARELILKGKTNEEVLSALTKLGVDPEAKRHYPGWYRAQLVREGKLSKRQASATRH